MIDDDESGDKRIMSCVARVKSDGCEGEWLDVGAEGLGK